jgi:hypothetical protein
MAGKAVTSAQRLAARHHGATLPPAEADPYTQAQEALEDAPAKPAAGWSTGGPEAVLKASRAAVEARRKRG